MSILIDVEEYFRNRKIKNRKKIFESVQKAVRSIDCNNNGSDGAVFALASACNYDTFYFTLNRILSAIKIALKTEKKKEARKYYKGAQTFFGFLKLVMDFYGGYLGFLWL